MEELLINNGIEATNELVDDIFKLLDKEKRG